MSNKQQKHTTTIGPPLDLGGDQNSIMIFQVGTTAKPSSSEAEPHSQKGVTTIIAIDDSSETKVDAAKSEKKLMDLKKKFGSDGVHDVIVVGEHVEGDDLLLDYDDHSSHHKESHSKHSHHGDGDEHSDRIDHDSSGAKKNKKTGGSSEHAEAKVKVSESEKDTNSSSSGHKDDHKDHEHLLEGLLAGDVIHIDAGGTD